MDFTQVNLPVSFEVNCSCPVHREVERQPAPSGYDETAVKEQYALGEGVIVIRGQVDKEFQEIESFEFVNTVHAQEG